MSKRSDAKAATRAKLVAVARAAFERHGYGAVTFRSLAKGADVSTGAYFANWKSKADLFAEATGQTADIAAFLDRVAISCAGFPGHLSDLAEDALKLKAVMFGRG